MRCFRSAPEDLLLLFMGKTRNKSRVACTVAKAADIKWYKMQWRIYAKCRPVTSLGHQVAKSALRRAKIFSLF